MVPEDGPPWQEATGKAQWQRLGCDIAFILRKQRVKRKWGWAISFKT